MIMQVSILGRYRVQDVKEENKPKRKTKNRLNIKHLHGQKQATDD